jgi:hypothetical protein
MRGRTKALSLPRRAICDLSWISKGAPLVSIEREIAAAPVATARADCADRPLWTAIFSKAIALTARQFPALRQVYLPFPWPHLYEYPTSIANIVLEREYEGEPAIFPCLIKSPEDRAITDISRLIKYAAAGRLEEIKDARRMLMVARYPLLIRRGLWWTAFNIGRQRANYFGTFTLSVLASQQIDVQQALLAWTSFFSYGPLKPDGKLRVPIWFDHRVLDGGTAARALAYLEEVLNGPIVDELRSPPPCQTQDALDAAFLKSTKVE